MNGFIVKESIRDIKGISKNYLEKFWLKVIGGVLLYTLLTNFVPVMFTFLTPKSLLLTVEGISVSYLSGLYNFFTAGALSTGICSYMLMFLRRRDANPGYIFNGFGYYFKTLGLMLIVSLFTFLWSLLFIIPGFIAAIRYSQAFYILADDPSKGIMQCLNESKALMAENKMKFFLLMFSFIGWMIILAFAQTTAMAANLGPIASDLLFLIPSAALSSYVYTALTVFYELASGSLRAGHKEPDFIEESELFDD